MNWYFGGRHCRSVTFVDDVAGSLAGDSFDLNVINGENTDADGNWTETRYLVWMDDGVASAPTPAADQTLVALGYSQNDSAAAIAANYKSVLDALTDFFAKSEQTGATVEVQNSFVGEITAEVNTNAASFTYAIGETGFGGFLGQVASGGATLAIEETVLDVTSDNTGSIVLDKILTGVNNTITMTLAEMSTERWKQIVGNVSGDIFTSGSDEIVGWGESKLYKSKFGLGGRLVGHPIRLALTDRSADISMFTAPGLTSINFSGQDIQGAEVEFVALLNRNVSNKVSLARRGDHTLL